MNRLVLLALLLLPLTGLRAEWQPDPADKRQVAASKALADIRARIPRAGGFMDDAYAYAIWPGVTRLGFGFGGAYGKGIVVEGDEMIGTTGFWQFTSGIQAGARWFSMVILFKDKEALEYFKTGRAQFMGQAGLAAANVGVAGTPAYNDGMAIFAVTRLALMGEFTVSGAKFTFKPVAVTTQDE